MRQHLGMRQPHACADARRRSRANASTDEYAMSDPHSRHDRGGS
jgi:hypothetical protein